MPPARTLHAATAQEVANAAPQKQQQLEGPEMKCSQRPGSSPESAGLLLRRCLPLLAPPSGGAAAASPPAPN